MLIAVLGATFVAGLALQRAAARHPPRGRVRRRLGAALLVATALAVIGGGAGALAATGPEHAWHQLFSPSSTVPTSGPQRLTAAGNVHARYWQEGMQVLAAHPALGTGAGGFAVSRLRYSSDSLDVEHAHSFVVQTLADLGIVGGLVALALFLAWATAALRTLGVVGQRRGRAPAGGNARSRAERAGLWTLAATVVVFGVHALIDWTWAIPGTAILALICAGFLAGYGGGARARANSPATGVLHSGLRGRAPRLLAAALVVVAALAGGWYTWQPLRSAEATSAAELSAAAGHVVRARKQIATARARDPYALQPLYDLASFADAAHHPRQAVGWFRAATRLAPDDPDTWDRLGVYELYGYGGQALALQAFTHELHLAPRLPSAVSHFLGALRAYRYCQQTPKPPNC
jgi:Flp pilus assembly protein TadD